MGRSPRVPCRVAAKPTPLHPAAVETKTALVHGRSVSYVEAGAGPVLLLIHGMAGTLRELGVGDRAARPAPHRDRPRLARPRVSEPGGGDYSLGGLAAGLRDLLLALGHERATLVGHSLGGGIAMQFTYQFPEMVERLASSPAAASAPRSARCCAPPRCPAPTSSSPPPPASAGGSARCSAAASARSACVPTPTSPRSPAATPRSPTPSAAGPSWRPCARSSAPTGQRVAAADRLYLAEALPMLIVWGARDPIIPVEPRRRGPRDAARQPPRDLRRRRPPAAARGAGPLRRRPRALPRRDRAGRGSTARSGGPASARLTRTTQLERARQDSNLWPLPPEGSALSS